MHLPKMPSVLWTIITLIISYFGYSIRSAENSPDFTTTKASPLPDNKESKVVTGDELEIDRVFVDTQIEDPKGKCMLFDYNLLDHFTEAQGILKLIYDAIEKFEISNYIYTDFDEKNDRLVFMVEEKYDFKTSFSECYRQRGEMFKITSAADLVFLRSLTQEPIWQYGKKVDQADAILYSGNLHSLEFMPDGTSVKTPEEDDETRCKVFDSVNLNFTLEDCENEYTLVCEREKSQEVLDLKYLGIYKSELLQLIQKITALTFLSPTPYTLAARMTSIKIDDTMCTGVVLDSLANVLGLEKFVKLFKNRKIGIREIASKTLDLYDMLKYIVKFIDVNEENFYNLIKYKLFGNLDIALFQTSSHDKLCGCNQPQIVNNIKNHFKYPKRKFFKQQQPENETTPDFDSDSELESFLLDFRLVEILSCLFSLVALIVSMINSLQKKDAKKRDEKVAKLYLNDLQSISSKSELGEKPVSQIPRHVSLPNIKKVTLVEPTLDSPMPSPTSSINTPETGVFMP